MPKIISLENVPSEIPYAGKISIQRLLQQQEIPGIGISMVEIPAGETLQEHFHTKTKAFTFVLEGAGIVKLNGKEHVIKKNDIVIYPEKTTHSFRAIKGILKLLSVESPPVYSPETKERDTIFVQK